VTHIEKYLPKEKHMSYNQVRNKIRNIRREEKHKTGYEAKLPDPKLKSDETAYEFAENMDEDPEIASVIIDNVIFETF